MAATLLIGILSACDSPSIATSEPATSPRTDEPSYAAAIRADLARWDAPGKQVVAVGTTWRTNATVADVSAYLEALLVPPAGPRFTYDPYLLNGGSSITSSGAPESPRTVEFSAWTHCSGCSSGLTETGGEMTMTLVQNGSHSNAFRTFGNLSPYSSGWYTMGISGPRADASISTKHVGRYNSNTYFRYSSAGRTV